KTIAALEALVSGLGALLKVPISEWADEVRLRPKAISSLASFRTLDEVAADVEARLKRGNIRVTFKGEPAYPPNLAQVRDAPPLLFHWGKGAAAPPRRRLAMVGTRHPEQGFNRWAHGFTQYVAA